MPDYDSMIQNHSSIDFETRGQYSYVETQNIDWANNSVWTIETDEQIKNETSIITDSILIKQGGSLSIEHSNILINSSDSPIIIVVEEGGILLIENSIITLSNVTCDIGYNIRAYGTFKINNSELNYLCYLTANYPIESCSGPEYYGIFSPGIEIFSNSVEITGSRFNFARNSTILIDNANPKIINNVFKNNTRAMAISNSKINISNNKFFDNYFGIEVFECDIAFSNSTFISTYPGSIKSGILGYKSSISLNDIEVWNSQSIIVCQYCNISVSNSYFEMNEGFTILDSFIDFYNNTFFDLLTYTSFYNVNGYFRNNLIQNNLGRFEFKISQNLIIENNSILSSQDTGIEINVCDVILKNNLINDSENGIFVYSSIASIENNSIQNCSFMGIGCESSLVNITDNMMANNLNGIILLKSSGLVSNNKIIQNFDGIICFNTNSRIIENLIANNSGWGINITGTKPILSGNLFSNKQQITNGYGRLIKSSEVEVLVKDLYGKYIHNYELTIFTENKDRVISKSNVMEPELYQTYVPEYEIRNSGKKQEFSNYLIECSWGYEGIGYTTVSKVFNIKDSTRILLNMPLPDLYVISEEIAISSTKPKQGDKINIEVTIHYSGQVDVRNIPAKITANEITIKKFKLNFNGTIEQKIQNYTVNLDWTIPELLSGITGIKVIIETNSIENQFLNYDKNNSAIKMIEIKENQADNVLDWTDESGMYICSLIILITIIIIILIFILIFKKRNKPEQSESPKQSHKEIQMESKKGLKKGIKKVKKEPMEKLTRKSKNKSKDKSKNISEKKLKDKSLKNDSEKLKDQENDDVRDNRINENKQTKKSLKETLSEELTSSGPRIKW
jgi:hypothetical protein